MQGVRSEVVKVLTRPVEGRKKARKDAPRSLIVDPYGASSSGTAGRADEVGEGLRQF